MRCCADNLRAVGTALIPLPSYWGAGPPPVQRMCLRLYGATADAELCTESQ
jgi:hypothetical protein